MKGSLKARSSGGFCMDNLEEALRLEVRRKIYGTVQQNPGLHFREIQRRVGIATGALQYHLDYLGKKHLVRSEKDAKFLRYYLVREEFKDTQLMGLLRQGSMRKIIVFLMQRRFANNVTISNAVGLSPSTTSWHVEKLSGAGILSGRKHGRKSYYSLADKDRVAQLLVGYKASFLDEMVDNFVEVWEEI